MFVISIFCRYVYDLGPYEISHVMPTFNGSVIINIKPKPKYSL